MDIASLLHSLTVAGLCVRPGLGGTLEVVGDVSKVTPTQREALSAHKSTLLAMLAPPPTCYPPREDLVSEDDFAEELAERFAIQWVESTGTQHQVSQALAEAIEFFEQVIDGQEPQPKQPPPPPPPRFFLELKAAHDVRDFDLLTLESQAQEAPCCRCGSRQTCLAKIHGGESLRRDCASCGRFREFAAWKEKEKAKQILANATGQSRYNTKAGCSSATNTQATLTPSP